MPLLQLTAESLADLELGSVGKALNRAIETVVRDCMDRPADERARKVTLQINLKPVKSVNGNTIDCEGARGICQVRAKLPDLETGELDFGVRHNGSLVFQSESPRNHRQETMFEAPGDAAE